MRTPAGQGWVRGLECLEKLRPAQVSRRHDSAQDTVTEQTIARITKNSRETLHVTLTEYHGHQFCSLRIFFLDDHGELKPGKQGISLRYADLPQVIDALHSALKIATARGLA